MTEEIPIWIVKLQQEDNNEEKSELDTPVTVLHSGARRFIWWLCREYKTTAGGVMGQASSLLERVLAKKTKVLKSSLPLNSKELYLQRMKLINSVPVLASVCIGLTSKMMSTEHQLSTKIIRNKLAEYNLHLTLQQVNAIELEVLSTLDFYIPLYTNVEKASMMAAEVGLTGAEIEAVAVVTEIAEFYRAAIQHEVISIGIKSAPNGNDIRPQDVTNVRHMHLVAGTIIATVIFIKYINVDPVPRLVFLTTSSRGYLECIGHVVFKKLVFECINMISPVVKPSEVPNKKMKLTKH